MMTRSERVRLIFWLTVIGLIIVGFAAEGLLKSEVCVSAMIQDQTSMTVYPTVCE
jgi:hypothetical protein